ncbi:ABC transporter ATP-binding protein [Shumkonia mesophila]|uniref:ABC transporter ATP-binding protein n=1 Tax=Shumkonia mesophila TaxID=2838854 RepID=UPI0029345EDE|nr:sn-glycerol-3-phosphate ABC transporter ATP-binding protein UgpC [Shumkonia mesophila]
MATVSIRDVHKSFGPVKVIHGVSLDIADGEFVVLVGPSGCGKSTLLRMIAGLEEVTAGEIHIGDRRVDELLPRDRDVAMVFQSYALYPLKNVFDNMAFGLRMRRSPRATIDQRVNGAASILGLQDYLQRLPKELSGGQRQRVAMGRAIVRAPQVFLFDEPLSNLDARLRVQMRIEIKLRHQQLRTTTVYVTHDQIEAMTMADRIAVMHDGIVEQVGTPLELYDQPANTFVAEFIGSPSINMIPGRLRRAGSQAWVETGQNLRLPVSPQADGLDGQSVLYGVRPETVAVGSKGSVRTRVDLVELVGANLQVFAKVGSQQVCAILDRSNKVTAGDDVWFGFEPQAVHLFDEQTGRRV